MISIESINPEFSVNFPSPVPVKEIALAKLRVYNSWPNIRSKIFGGQQPNNSLVFSYKNRDDGTPDWNIVSIPTGSYEIEKINEEFQRRIKSITGKESKIAITVHEPSLSSAIEISTEGYFVDIYNSSIRKVLGWPENPPSASIPTPEPVKSDYVTDKIGPENPSKGYKTFLDINFTKRYRHKDKDEYGKDVWTIPFFNDYIPQEGEILEIHETAPALVDIESNIFRNMNKDFKLLLPSLRSGLLTQAEFTSVVAAGNKIIDDMEIFNSRITGLFTDENNPISKTSSAENYKKKIKGNPNYKLPGYNAPELKNQLNVAIEEGFKIIYDEWSRKKPLTILTHNNSQNSDGRHIAPNNVNISSVIALNLTCDAIEGSYQINLQRSNQAQEGYILYSFAPSVSPGYLIIEDPTNPVYMRCHNDTLTRINFKLTDQSNNLIDLRGEILAISLYVKS